MPPPVPTAVAPAFVALVGFCFLAVPLLKTCFFCVANICFHNFAGCFFSIAKGLFW